MNKLVVACLLILCQSPAPGQDVDFFSEDLTFRIREGFFEVEGTYSFRNNTAREVNKMLFYPFPDTDYYGEISYISISTEGDTNSQLATVSNNGSLFKLSIGPSMIMTYMIRYGQKLKSGEARYIITTTKKWGKPLETAHYRLIFASDIQMDSVSVEPDTIVHVRGITEYRWERVNFMPEKDFIFKFSQN